MTRPARCLALLPLVALLAAGCAPSEPALDAAGLVRQMHDRYADVRPASIAFVQTTVLHRDPDAAPDTSTWYEAAVPGRLRIDIAPLENGNGALFSDGMLTSMRNGSVAVRRPEVNPLQLLLMDVFQFDPDRTIEILDTLGFDLSIFRKADWDGTPVWVAGAEEGDLESAQFWVDRERLVTVRVIQPVGGGTNTWDVRVTGFRTVDGYPQEDALLMYIDGRLWQEEYYREIHPGIDLDPALFDTTDWTIDRPYWD